MKAWPKLDETAHRRLAWGFRVSCTRTTSLERHGRERHFFPLVTDNRLQFNSVQLSSAHDRFTRSAAIKLRIHKELLVALSPVTAPIPDPSTETNSCHFRYWC